MIRRSRIPWRGSVLLLFGGTCLASYLWAAASRANAFSGKPLFLIALAAVTLGMLWSPLRGALAVFFVIPFFGNFPGGRWMEVLNIPLAAGIVGLVLHARRRGLPPPRGRLWIAALLYVASAALAFVPSLEGVAVRLAQINFLPEAMVETLTARETDPLYSLSSFLLLALAAGWSYALAWASPGTAFARNALRCVAASFALFVALGALDLHGAIDLESVLRRIDERSLSTFVGFQSAFWNASWFAFYFVMAFGLLLGLPWLETRRGRLLLGALLAVSYVYFLTNSQRGGFLALHSVLLAALAHFAWRTLGAKRALLVTAAASLVGAALLAVAVEALPREGSWGLALARMSEKDPVRPRLAAVAALMWKDDPVFGIGEGAFTWRHREYVPAGSALDTGFWGDAHSTWLQILATRGLFGLAAYVFLLFALARCVVRAARRPDGRPGIGLALGLSLVAFGVYSFVQYMFYLQAIQVLFWGIAALAAIAAPEEPNRPALARRWRWPVTVAAVGLLALQLGSSWPRLRSGGARLAREPRGFSGVEKWGETPMRWSSRRGTLCLYPTAPVVLLQVLSAHPGLAARPLVVSLEVEGKLVDRFEVNANVPMVRSFYLVEAVGQQPGLGRPQGLSFGECLADSNPVRLGVEVSRTWSPLSRGVSGDTRHLGVAIFEPAFEPARPAMELGLASRDGSGQERWMGPRASLSVRVPADRARVTVPLRAPNLGGRRDPVGVEAFWNGARIASASLSDANWHDLTFDVTAPERWGVLTLQVDRARRNSGDDSRGVQVGSVRGSL